MATRAEQRKSEALRSAIAHGHVMKPFISLAAGYYYSGCEKCGMGVYVNINPLPDENKQDIHGEAVEKDCSYPREGRR